MIHKVDYNAIDIPKNKDPRTYTYLQRRAEMLDLILESGNVRFTTQQKLAERYGVNQSQISHDLDSLSDYIRTSFGKRANAHITAVFTKAIKELQNDNKHYKAAKVGEMFSRFMFDTGGIEKIPEKTESEVVVTWEDPKKTNNNEENKD